MNKTFILAGLALLGLGFAGRTRAATVLDGFAAQDLGAQMPGADPEPMPGPVINDFGAPYVPAQANDGQANILAFLLTIATSEGTEGRGLDPYRVCYGYKHTVQSMADHPAVTGEWPGEKLPDGMCAAAGLGPGCVSTAAGRYQIIKPTWLRARKALGLMDFSPDSQDAAAVWLIAQRGGLEAVQAGKFAQAMQAVRREWASLPGSGWGQPEQRMERLAAVYQQAGGTVA